MTEDLAGGSRGVWFATWHTQGKPQVDVCPLYRCHIERTRLKQEKFHYPYRDFFSRCAKSLSTQKKTWKSTGHEQSDQAVSEVSAFRTVQSQAYSIPDCPIQFIKSIWVSAGPAFPVSGRYKLYVSQRWYSSCERNNILCISTESISVNTCHFFK